MSASPDTLDNMRLYGPLRILAFRSHDRLLALGADPCFHLRQHTLSAELENVESREVYSSSSTNADSPGDEREETEALAIEIELTLDEEPVESGYSHRLERVLGEALATQNANALEAICASFNSLHYSSPMSAAGLIQCIGRLPQELFGETGELLAVSALWSQFVEIREAGVSVVDHWRSEELIGALRSINEQVPWLSRYIQKVLETEK